MRKISLNRVKHWIVSGLLLLSVENAVAQNLLVNGDFESTGGFSSQYTLIPNPTGNTGAGQYGIGKNPRDFNTGSFISMGDRTTGNGNMMIVDGTNNGGNPEPFFWRVGNAGEIGGLMVGQPYTFSYWIKSIYQPGIPGATVANIGIKWNNVQGLNGQGLLPEPTTGNALAPAPGADWARVSYTFIPTNSFVRIEMFNWNGGLAGNDFAIDDLELMQSLPLRLRYSVTPPTCQGLNNGYIAAYASGGSGPYSFRFNGGAFGSSGFLTGLGPSTGISITVRDANNQEVTVNNITIADGLTNPLSINAVTTICQNGTQTLTASGGTTYAWSASPVDGTLTTPTAATINVRPTVKTTYTVTSPVSSTRNLIFNGDFSQGDIGFSSDYLLRETNPDGNQGIYGIVANAQSLFPGFLPCLARGGSGQMLVADGATIDNFRIWCQRVPVTPNTTYTFRYYVQSVQTNNPAVIETRVNGTPITGNAVSSTQTAPATTCTWQEVTYTWNSGANTIAEICLFDRNLNAGGNDFAIDDISFTGTFTCNFSRALEVNPVPVGSVTQQPSCGNPSGTFSFSFPLGSQYRYFIVGQNIQVSPDFRNLSPGTYSARVRDNNAGCQSVAVPFTITAAPGVPPTPVATVTAQPTCLNSGTITITAPTGPNYEYSIDSGRTFSTRMVYANLLEQECYVVVRDKNNPTCPSNFVFLRVNAQPPAPPFGFADIIHPNCKITTGSLRVTTPLDPDFEYSLDGTTYQDNVLFTGLAPGNYNISVRTKSTGCVSRGGRHTILPIPPPPPVPLASVTLAATCTVGGTITISFPLGDTLSYSIDGTNYQASPVFTNVPQGTYQLRVQSNTTFCVSGPTSITIAPPVGVPPAPGATATVQPSCIVPTGTIVISSPTGPTFDYTIDGTNWQPGVSFTGLEPATYQVRVRLNTNGCVSLATPVTINPVPGPPATAQATVTTQPNCMVNTGTITITAPVGPQLRYTVDGNNWQAGTQFSGLAPGATVTIRVLNTQTGCISDPATLSVNPIPAPPADPQATVTVQPDCRITTGSIVVTAPTGSNLVYSLNGTTWQNNTTFSGLAPGSSHQLRVRNTETGCISGTLALSVNAIPPPPVAPTATVTQQPTCNTPSGTITITAPTGSNLEYSTDGNNWQVSTVFTQLAPNSTANIRVRNTQTGCVSTITALTLNAIPAAPAAPIAGVTAQPTCINPTGNIVITAPSGNNLEYSVDGTTWQPSRAFNNLQPGLYNVRVRDTQTGCISALTPLTIGAVPPPPATPVAAVTVVPSCITPTGTIVVSSPVGTQLEYSITGNNWQSAPSFAGLTPGAYSVRVRNSQTGCISGSVSLTVPPVPSPPETPTGLVTIQPDCYDPTGIIHVTSPLGMHMEYSLNGITWRPSPIFTGLAPATAYSLRARNVQTGCISGLLVLQVNPLPDPPPTPVVVATVQPNCIQTTGTISVSNPVGPIFTYSINGALWQDGRIFSGLTPGTTYLVRAKDNITGCISNQTPIAINSIPPPPAAPTVRITAQPTCSSPFGTLAIDAPTGSALEYSLNGTNWQASAVFSNLAPGSAHAVRVRNTQTGCISDITNATIAAVPAAPATPVAAITAQPTCTSPTGSISISSPQGTQLQYSINGNTWQASPVFDNIAPGTTVSITARNTETGCISNSLSLTINPVPAPPAPATAMAARQPDCYNPAGEIRISAPLGPELAYSINGTSWLAGTTFSNLLPGTYNVRVRDNTTGCISAGTSVVINALPAPPASPSASATSQPTCIVPYGTISVSAPLGANLVYSIDGINYKPENNFINLIPGIYPVTVRNITTGCLSNATSVTITRIPDAPVTPTGTVIQQPTCAVPSGAIQIAGPIGSDFQYTLDRVNYQPGTLFNNLAPGEYFIWVKSNTTGCVSSSVTLRISAIPPLPPAPVASVTVQPTCTMPSGIIEISSPTGSNMEYSLDGNTWQSSNRFAGIAPGNYSVRVRQTDTRCISNFTELTVLPVPPPPATPAAAVVAQPNCNIPAGTIEISSPAGSELEYSLTGSTWQKGLTFGGLNPGTYDVRVRNINTGCISNITTLTVNPVPAPPAIPMAVVSVQPDCITTTGTIIISSPAGAALEYSLDGNLWQSGTTFSGLAPGTYGVRVRNTQTFCLSGILSLTVNPIPAPPAAPVVSVTAQPTCSTPTGTLTVNTPVANNLEYSLNGTTWQSATIFTGLQPGTYQVRVRHTPTGCVSANTAALVNPIPNPPAVPVINITAQPGCTTTTGSFTVTSPTGNQLEYSVNGVTWQSAPVFSNMAAGTYRVTVRDAVTACSITSQDAVINTPPPVPAAPVVVSPIAYCQFATGIPALTATGTSLTWYNTPTGGTGQSIAPQPVATVPGSTTWYVSQTNAQGCEGPRAALTVVIEGLPSVTTQPKRTEIMLGQSVTLNGTVTGQNLTIRWSPATDLSSPGSAVTTARPQQTTTYRLTATTPRGCTASDTVRVVVIRDVIIPNVFSPNGDGTNDKWMIKYLEDYPAAVVEVYNRYGQLIFSNRRNGPQWDGTVNGQPVPVGAYFYVITLGNNKVFKGTISVVR